LVHKQPQNPWRSMNEYSAQELKKWNTKYLRKLEKPHYCTSSEPTRQQRKYTQTEKIHHPNSTRQTWVTPQYKN
jgi:hypothetical protein